MSHKLNIGLLWCTYFQPRSFWSRPWQLYDAYRPPSLFASKMRDAGHSVEFLVCDNLLQISDLDGTSRTLQDNVELLYIMTHGEFAHSGYDVFLHATNWQPGNTGIGASKLVVAIFDTCELLNTSRFSNWQNIWGTAKLGNNLRLMLGFDGAAVIDRSSAERGKALAENLINGWTFADAWITAVANTCAHSQYRRAVAIGIGDKQADAASVLNSASVASMPLPRSGASGPSLQERY